MVTRCSDDSAPVRSDGVTRREVLLRVGGGGIAVALAVHGIETTRAQDATPPAGGGLPAGVSAMPLTGVPIKDMPTAPFTINVTRLTLEPGALIPDSAVPYPTFAYLEAGAKVVCPNTDGGLVLYDAAGKEIPSSDSGEFAWPVGTGCYTPPNTMDGVRNDGTDQASFLNVELMPTPEGTPVTTAGGGLPAGVSAAPLFGVSIKDMPTAPFTIKVLRLTLEPGAATPLSAAPFPQLGYVEAGEKLICPPANEHRWVYGPDGKLLDSGAGEFAFPLGSVCYWSPNTMDGVRNDGTDQGSILRMNLVPTP